MFATVEKYRGAAKVLLALISLALVGFGVSTVANPNADFIAKVGKRKISQEDVREALQNMEAGSSSQSVFQSLLQRAYLLEGASEMGIGVSLEQLKQVIVNDPAFHDETGRFSQQKFNDYLNQRRLTEDRFIEQIRSQFELQNLINLAQAGTVTSDVQIKQIAAILESPRIVRTTVFDPRAFMAGIKAEEGDLKAYFEKNKANYTLPQAVKFEFVALSADSLAEKQTVSEDELKQAFEEQTRAAQPKREVAHIMLRVPSENERAKIKAEAEKVLALAKNKPDDFSKLAQQYSQDTESAGKGGSLGMSWPKAFADEAFRLGKGEIGNLVETPEAFHIIRVLDIAPKVSFEQEKARLSAELKQKKAQQEMQKLRTVLEEESFAAPDSLETVARKTGLKVEKADEWFSKEAAAERKMPSELIDALFSDEVFKKKHNSEPIPVNGQLWVVRATETREASEQAFDTVKERVKQAYIAEKALSAAQEKAKQTLADLQSGKAAGVSWLPTETLSLQQARSTMPPQAFEALLKARPGNGKPAYALLEGLSLPVVVEVSEIKEPQVSDGQNAAMRQALQVRNSESVVDNLLNYLQKNISRKQGAQKLDTEK